jgi:hypothetical protein
VRRSQLTDEAVVVLRHLPEVGPCNRRDVLALIEEADDQCRPLHRLNDSVEQHTIEARVLQPDALAVVLDDRVHGGPPDVGSRTTSHRKVARRSPTQAPVNPGDSKGGAPCLVERPGFRRSWSASGASPAGPAAARSPATWPDRPTRPFPLLLESLARGLCVVFASTLLHRPRRAGPA